MNKKVSIRSKQEIYEMLAKVTTIAKLEHTKGNKEHAQLMIAVGLGLRWVIHDYDFLDGYDNIEIHQK